MATNDELLRQWAQENGADYNLLAGAQNGNTQTTPTTGSTGSGNTNNDLYSEYGWDSSNLPGTSIPTTTTPTTTTTGGTSTGGTSGYTMQDYFNYYGNDWTKADKDYNEWVAWMQSGGGNTTTPTNPGTTTGGTTTPTTGYDNTGTTTTPTTTTPTTGAGTATGGTTRDQALAEFSQISQRVQAGTATPADYARAQELMNIINGGTGSTGTGGTGTGTGTGTSGTGGTASNVDAMTEWNQIMARVNAGQGTIADYYRLQELANILSGGTGGSGTGGTAGIGGTTGGVTGGNVTHSFPTVDADNRQRIADMYDAQINAQRAALQEQGSQALSDAISNREKIADTYNAQRNAASVDWERQRRNFLEGAATSGINTGSRSQAELSMNSMYQRTQTALGNAQAQAETEANRNIADIKRSTQASINEAIAKNDYQKAAALLDEYNAQYNRAVERAEALGQYGDFSGYAALYGDAAAAQMRYTWIMSNPEIALATGQITQQQYAQLALYSQYPALALAGGSAGGGGSYSGGGGSGVDYDNQGHSTAAISAIQQTLQNAGYYNGNVDGLAGDQTNAAIAAWNNDHPDNQLHL